MLFLPANRRGHPETHIRKFCLLFVSSPHGGNMLKSLLPLRQPENPRFSSVRTLTLTLNNGELFSTAHSSTAGLPAPPAAIFLPFTKAARNEKGWGRGGRGQEAGPGVELGPCELWPEADSVSSCCWCFCSKLPGECSRWDRGSWAGGARGQRWWGLPGALHCLHQLHCAHH